MKEPALSEAVKTDLQSPKPNRRRRLALRFAVLVVAVSVMGAAYWFTRPPELVWWRSDTIGSTPYRLRFLIPHGWVRNAPQRVNGWTTYSFRAVDGRPSYLRWLLPESVENGWVDIEFGKTNISTISGIKYGSEISRREETATRYLFYTDIGIRASIGYQRTNRTAFNRTYRRICSSLTIE
jgi:hypothetical protein